MAKNYGGILAGTEEIINECLFDDKSRSYGHISEGRKLKQFPASKDCNAENMVIRLIQKIRNNLNEREEEGNSTQNWREKLQPNIDENNGSKEICLERAIAKMLDKFKIDDWWNQMPIASGLVNYDKDRRRAIDLVHRCNADSTSYDFVELKIDSNTPLFALMEILLYGLVYLVLRKKRDWLPDVSRDKPVFKAKKIGLRILAPKKFYQEYDLSWLERELTVALAKVIEHDLLEGNLLMEISSHWPVRLEEWDAAVLTDDETLISIMQDWKPAFE